jgi:hypothetical protein
MANHCPTYAIQLVGGDSHEPPRPVTDLVDRVDGFARSLRADGYKLNECAVNCRLIRHIKTQPTNSAPEKSPENTDS